MIPFWLVLVIAVVALILLARYTPRGTGEEQIAPELARVLGMALVVLIVLVTAAVKVWHHLRWTP